jgi:hypothetical protein
MNFKLRVTFIARFYILCREAHLLHPVSQILDDLAWGFAGVQVCNFITAKCVQLSVKSIPREINICSKQLTLQSGSHECTFPTNCIWLCTYVYVCVYVNFSNYTTYALQLNLKKNPSRQNLPHWWQHWHDMYRNWRCRCPSIN